MAITAEPMPVGTPARRSALERFLGLFADVHGGEGATALLLTLNVFLLLLAYYIIKPLREAFILQGGPIHAFGWTIGKAELKSYASAGMAALFIGIVPLYGRLASAVARQRLITYVTLFFVANLVVFYVLVKGGIPAWLGVTFFLWVGIFNVLVVAQFWSFANDIYLPDQGKRLFAIVGFGGSLGAVLGAWVAGHIMGIGQAEMLLVAGAVLLLCILMTNIVHRREAARHSLRLEARSGGNTQVEAEKPVGKEGAVQLLLRDRYLLLIGLLMLLANLVNTTGEYLLSAKVTQAAHDAVTADASLNEGAYIGHFYSNFYLAVNTLGLVMQLFIVSRILKYFGVRVALLVLPLIAIGGYAAIALGATLAVVRLAKVLENATDYSLEKTTANVLFLPTTRAAKYKAKQAIDTFFVRIGDFSSAMLVFLGTQKLAFSIERFATFNLVLGLLWIFIAVAIVRRYLHLAAAPPRENA